jgi:hypothetical protein
MRVRVISFKRTTGIIGCFLIRELLICRLQLCVLTDNFERSLLQFFLVLDTPVIQHEYSEHYQDQPE